MNTNNLRVSINQDAPIVCKSLFECVFSSWPDEYTKMSTDTCKTNKCIHMVTCSTKRNASVSLWIFCTFGDRLTCHLHSLGALLRGLLIAALDTLPFQGPPLSGCSHGNFWVFCSIGCAPASLQMHVFSIVPSPAQEHRAWCNSQRNGGNLYSFSHEFSFMGFGSDLLSYTNDVHEWKLSHTISLEHNQSHTNRSSTRQSRVRKILSLEKLCLKLQSKFLRLPILCCLV